MKYGFYISGRSTRLGKFLRQASSYMKSNVKVVISDSAIDSRLVELLDAERIESYVIDFDELPGDNRKKRNVAFSDKMLVCLKEKQVDYCFLFGDKLLSGRLLDEYKNRIINFHPSILPAFPGLKAIDQAVDHGNVFLVGNTAHFIDSGVDSGLVIMQSVTTMYSFLMNRDYSVVLDMQIPMLNKIIKSLDKNEISIVDNRVVIQNADYSIGHIYPQL